jgi:Domain of unknown function (DUF4490)
MQTTYQELNPKWHAFNSSSLTGQNVPKISEVLARRPTVRRPNRVHVDISEFAILNREKEIEANLHADRIMSAHKLPWKFPVRSENICYPIIDKHGSGNPLFATTYNDIGSKKPLQHQLAERYFPLSSRFSKDFAGRKAKNTAINTMGTKSAIHSSLDEPY